MKKIIPRLYWVAKKIYRLLRYRNEWKKTIREQKIKKEQNTEINKHFDLKSKKIILFLVPGSDWATGKVNISGGIMSIVSIYEETEKLNYLHQARTIMCTINDEHLFTKFDNFDNKVFVYRFEQLAKHFPNLNEIIIHLPELLVSYFIPRLRLVDQIWLKKMNKIHINIMNQSIWLMPQPKTISELYDIADKVTISTAHQKYCTPYYKDYYNVPIHKLSVWISPEQYLFKSLVEKEDIIIVSPDEHPMKNAILQELRKVDGLSIQIIQGITYEKYKNLASKAKWSLTFGEGLDGYFIEPVFSGAVSFAVYNDSFFTSDFQELETVYSTWDELQKDIVKKITSFDLKEKYSLYQQRQFDICAKHYNKTIYQENIKKFYEGNYTYV